MRKCSFLTLELALLLALAVTLLWGAWSLHRQDDLQEKMIRLHVIANSDSDADQTLKLCVRDAVLCRAEEILRQSADMTESRARLRDSLPDIGDAAAQELAAQGVRALLAGGMGMRPLNAMQAAGITVYYNAGQATVGDALKAFAEGKLQAFGTEQLCRGGCNHHH